MDSVQKFNYQVVDEASYAIFLFYTHLYYVFMKKQ